MYIVDFKCKHCRKWKGEHRANTFECPVGSKTRIGYTQYGPDVYSPNPKQPKTVPFVIGNHYGEVEVSTKKKSGVDALSDAVGASIGNALADALNGIANIPAPKKKPKDDAQEVLTKSVDKALKKSSKAKPAKLVESPDQQSLLIVYEMMPEEVFLYFIPKPEMLAKNLYGALRAMENITVNCTELTPLQDKAFQYLNAAMCKKPENLDDQNPFDCNRFAHMLVPYLVAAGKESQPLFNLEQGRALRIIRSGFAM